VAELLHDLDGLGHQGASSWGSVGQGATEPKSAKPVGSWRPKVPCSNMPQPSTVGPSPSVQVARATWSTTPKGTRPMTAGSDMSKVSESMWSRPNHWPWFQSGSPP